MAAPDMDAEHGEDHMTTQLLSLTEVWPFLGCTLSATRAASVKASLTPRFFMAEHSGET